MHGCVAAIGIPDFACLSTLQVQRRPKIPKGTRDLLPDQMAIRELAFRTCVVVHLMLPTKHRPAEFGLWRLKQVQFPNACTDLTFFLISGQRY